MTKPGAPALSVIVPWANRSQIHETMIHNAACFDRDDTEILIVNCAGDAAQLQGVEDAYLHARVRIHTCGCDTFNKSKALNIGASQAEGELLFHLDADVLLDPGFANEALGVLSEEVESFVVLAKVRESEGVPVADTKLAEMEHLVTFRMKDGREATVTTNRSNFLEAHRSAPGMVLMRREHFIGIGGMNSELKVWGWEDLDLVVRLQLGLGLTERRAGFGVHLSHGDEERMLGPGGRARGEQENFSICMENYSLGKLHGTYDKDVASCQTKV